MQNRLLIHCKGYDTRRVAKKFVGAKKKADRIDDAVVKHNGLEEAVLQCRSEHRLNHRGVVPDIERAPENFRDERR